MFGPGVRRSSGAFDGLTAVEGHALPQTQDGGMRADPLPTQLAGYYSGCSPLRILPRLIREPTLIPCCGVRWKCSRMKTKSVDKPTHPKETMSDTPANRNRLQNHYRVARTNSTTGAAPLEDSAESMRPRQPWTVRNWGINE